MQSLIHYFLHFGFPLILACYFFPKEWRKVYFIWVATMIVDLDHLLASPIFMSDRCSIDYHPLHTYYAIAFYIFLLFLRRPLNLIGIGLLLHMATDLIDCMMMYSQCSSCQADAPAIALMTYIADFLGL